METCLSVQNNTLYLAIKVSPLASKTELRGIEGNRLKIRVAAPPEDDKANQELRAFLAKTLTIAKKDIKIVTGEKSRHKTLSLPLKTKETLETLLKTP